MEYRRSVALGIRFTMRILAVLFLLGMAAALVGIGPAWLRDRHVQVDMSHGMAVLELFLGIIERGVNPDPPAISQPSAALSGTAVVVLTGLAAAVAMGWGAHDLSDMIVPIAVLISTAVLAAFVYRFAKRHAGQIGEARFETTKP